MIGFSECKPIFHSFPNSTHIPMPYLVLATDHSDPDALDRRLAARPDHLVNARALEAAGVLQLAAASVDPGGKMSGSVLVLNVATLDDVKRIVESDLYWTTRVWASYTVQEIRVAIPSAHK
jgi:uncharacterized protein YciI